MDFSTLESWGYLAIAFFSFGGSLVIVATAAVFAYLGHIDLITALVVAAIANFLGDNFLFYLGKYQKKDIAKYLTKHKRKLAITRLLMRKYGAFAIFIQKFIYGVKTLIPIVMALSHYDFKKFIFFNFFASFIFVFTIGLSSYFFSDFIIRAFEYLKDKPYIAPLILVVIVGIIWQYLSKVERK
ncbi:MAG: DedA family protein [Epsilonproteobacteria bacterium]|nr:DedA family protein [Campylobacterota bacterium]